MSVTERLKEFLEDVFFFVLIPGFMLAMVGVLAYLLSKADHTPTKALFVSIKDRVWSLVDLII